MNRAELIENVARELCLSDGMEPDDEVIAGQAAGYENFGPRFQSAERSQNMCGNRNYMADSRVAIFTIFAAMLEPTREMREKGYEAIGDEDLNPTTIGMNDLWQAMLTASPLAPTKPLDQLARLDRDLI